MRVLVPAVLLAPACTPTRTPPPPSVVRPATHVDAPVDRTWNITVQRMATAGVTIKTIERASGVIATEDMSMQPQQLFFFDCGTDGRGKRIEAQLGRFNVYVTGDSTASTIKVTASYRTAVVEGHALRTIQCATTGRFESAFEAQVKVAAEHAH